MKRLSAVPPQGNEEGQQKDGKSSYCSAEMEHLQESAHALQFLARNQSSREAERNQRFTWKPWRSKQSSATANQSVTAI